MLHVVISLLRNRAETHALVDDVVHDAHELAAKIKGKFLSVLGDKHLQVVVKWIM
jgi:hypothetical protein